VDNGGWFTDSSDSANAKTFRDYIDHATCPPLNVGDLINLQNGQDTSVLKDLAVKLAERGGIWDTFLPVVDTDKFNTTEQIVAFVTFRITSVIDSTSGKGMGGTVLDLGESGTAEPGGQMFRNCGLLAPPKSVGN